MRRTLFLAFWALALAGAAHAALPAGNVLKASMARRTGDFAASAEYLRAALKADPESVELRIKLARLLMVFSEPDQALAILEEGLKLHPEEADLFFEKTKTLVLTGRTKEAAESALKASELGGGDKINIMAVRLLSNIGDQAKGLEVADKWVAASPDSPDAYYERALIHLAMSNTVKAEEDLRKVLEYRPGHQQTLEALADLLYVRNDHAEARKLYEKVVKANPHQTRARLTMAQILLEEGRADEAKAALEEAEKWVGNEPDDKGKLGLLFLQAGSPDRSLATLEALPEEKRDDRVWLFMGLAYMDLGRSEQAVKAFDRITEKSAYYGDMVERRAMALKAWGKTEEALEGLRVYVGKAPGNAQAVLALTTMLQGLERYEESAAILEKFIADNGDTKETGIFFGLGVARDKLGDWEKAVEYMQHILKISPDDAHALNYIGYTWAEHDVKLEEAEKMVKRAVELLPKNGYILDSLGWVYYKQGKYQEAIDTLERAFGLSQEDAVIMEHIGDAKLKAGDREGARKAYEKSLALDPKSKTVPQKVEALR